MLCGILEYLLLLLLFRVVGRVGMENVRAQTRIGSLHHMHQ